MTFSVQPPSPSVTSSQPHPPRTLQESLETFGGAWLAAGVTAAVGGVALLARFLV